jgi:hypothetical protein
MCLLVVYVRSERLGDIVDRVFDLVEVLVYPVEPTSNLSVVVGILPAGSLDESGGESGGDDGDGPDDGDHDGLRHGRSSPRM